MPLAEALRGSADCGWLVVDCLGLAFLPALRAALPDLFPSLKLEGIDFATVGPSTKTESLYGELAVSGVDHPFAKVNAVDHVIHERDAPFEDLCRLAIAELRLAMAGQRKRFDAARALVVFGDGFRLRVDGKAYVHGGASTLERVVPVLRLRARGATD